MKKNEIIPLEYDECVKFAEWLTLKKLKFAHIINENTIKNWAFLAKLKRMGWNKGLLDYIIAIPGEKARTRTRLFFVEMKRIKRSKVTEDQQEWIDILETIGIEVQAFVAYGADEAIERIEKYLC